MSTNKINSNYFSILNILTEEWYIEEWYRITQQHFIFSATNRKDGRYKVLEIIHNDFFSKKVWKTLCQLPNTHLLLPDNITAINGAHLLEFPFYLSLKELVRTKGLSFSSIILLIHDLCQSLLTLHQSGILHMDISVDNIFISEEGHFLLGDFSESCFLTTASSPVSHQTKNIMAPEYKTNPPTPSSEQYSLGILFYILCNDGIPPSDNFHGIIPNDLSVFQSMPEITDSLKAILSKILAPCSSNRYPDLPSLQQAIQMLQSELPDKISYYLYLPDETHMFHQTITTSPVPVQKKQNANPIFLIPLLFLCLILGLIALKYEKGTVTVHPNKERNISYDSEEKVATTTAVKPPVETTFEENEILDISNGQHETLVEALPDNLILSDILILFAENNNISNMDEVSALSNIREMYLSGNQIKDTLPFSTLANLEILILSDNNCTDLSGLKELQQLYFLDLSGNKDLSDISILSNLKQLKTLILTDTSVTDLSIHQLQNLLPQCNIIY